MDANQIATAILGLVFISAMFVPAISHSLAARKDKSLR
jgi:hypothetical protein